MHDNSSDADGVSARRPRRRWLGWALAVGILSSLFLLLDPTELWVTLSRLSFTEVVILLLLLTLDRVLMAVKWGILLRGVGVRIPGLRLLAAYYQGSFVGNLMPSHVAGDLLRAWLVARESGVHWPVYASLVMERMLGVLSAASWAVLGVVVLAVAFDPSHGLLWGVLGLLAVMAGHGLFWLSLHARTHHAILTLLGRGRHYRIVGFLHRFYEAYAAFSRNGRRLALVFLLTLLEHFVQMLIVFMVAFSLEIAAPPVLFFAATALYLLIFRIPIAPDGWGVGEATAIGVFAGIGVSAEHAFAMSVTSHVLALVALLPAALLFLARSRRISAFRDGAGDRVMSGGRPS